MNRFLTTTAIGLMLGLAPALAETQLPSNDNAPALEQPATPSEAVPANPADPTANADKASQVPPEVMAPVPGAEPLPQSSEIEKSPIFAYLRLVRTSSGASASVSYAASSG